MKKYPFLEAIGTVDEKFLEEALNDSKEQERRQISMNKRKTVTIMIAAVLVFTMAATAVAAGVSKLSIFGSYFEGRRQRSNIPDEVPIMNNPKDYANEVTTSTTTAQTEEVNGVVDAAGAIEAYTPPAPGEAKIIAVSATKHNMYMTLEINVAGMDIPKELPEDSSPTGQWYFDDMESNFRCAFPNMELISYENDIMTYGFWWRCPLFLVDKSALTEEERAQDEYVLKLKTLGYTAYSDPTPDGFKTKKFKAIKDLDIEIRLPLDEINIMEAIQSTNTGKLMDADFSMELSPYDLSVYSSFDSLAAAGFEVDDNEGVKKTTEKLHEYFWREAVVEYHMLDGTSFTEDFPMFTHNLVSGGKITFRTDERVGGAIYTFEVPLDITQVDYITINDVRFDFAH